VPTAFGTTPDVVPHGSKEDEFRLLVEFATSPRAAIEPGIRAAARLLGRERNSSSVSPAARCRVTCEWTGLRKVTVTAPTAANPACAGLGRIGETWRRVRAFMRSVSLGFGQNRRCSTREREDEEEHAR
jgi:hypothetical protein